MSRPESGQNGFLITNSAPHLPIRLKYCGNLKRRKRATSIQRIWCRGCSFSGSMYLDVKLRTSLGIRPYRTSGFNAALVKFNRVLLDCLPDNRTRRKVYRKAGALLKGGAAGPLKVVIDDAIEMRKLVRELKAREKRTTPQPDGEASSASLSQKESRSAPAPAEDGQGRSSASPSPQDSARRSS